MQGGSNSTAAISVTLLRDLPLFAPGMSVAPEVARAAARAGLSISADDVIVVAQKLVSKAEGCFVQLAGVSPSDEARDLAARTGRDPALVQLILAESSAVLRAARAAIIVRHRTGHVLANAGIDASNVKGGSEGTVLLWPADPDASARDIRRELAALSGAAPAVIIADSMGRAWRTGTLGHAIGCAGIVPVDDRRGRGEDLFGRTLQATMIGVADSLAAMAVLAMGEGAEGTPVAVVSGAGRWITPEDGPGMAAGLRPIDEDMFR
jgi:coenzyme F420-0:L-glutamate ligase/coenzyme F420-1:gamma-L-glutamate ligase